MLLFILGVVLGGIIGVTSCAICSISAGEKRNEMSAEQKEGNFNANQ